MYYWFWNDNYQRDNKIYFVYYSFNNVFLIMKFKWFCPSCCLTIRYKRSKFMISNTRWQVWELFIIKMFKNNVNYGHSNFKSFLLIIFWEGILLAGFQKWCLYSHFCTAPILLWLGDSGLELVWPSSSYKN